MPSPYKTLGSTSSSGVAIITVNVLLSFAFILKSNVTGTYPFLLTVILWLPSNTLLTNCELSTNTVQPLNGFPFTSTTFNITFPNPLTYPSALATYLTVGWYSGITSTSTDAFPDPSGVTFRTNCTNPFPGILCNLKVNVFVLLSKLFVPLT